MKNRMLAWAAVATLLAPLLGAQSFSHEISLSGLGDPNAFAKPFGIRYEPTTNRLYVPLAGDFSANNSAVAVIDAATDTVLHTIPVGLFPEDVAFAYDASGNYLYGAVTNSTSGSVTIWDANDSVVATVVLPDPWGMGSCYPFGICVNANNTHFLVSTNDGSGMVYAIEFATLMHDTMHDLYLNAGAAGRLKSNDGYTYFPTTTYTSSWSGSEAGLETLLRPVVGGQMKNSSIHKFQDDAWLYPSSSDVETLSDGRVLVSGMSHGGNLWVYNQEGILFRGVQTTDAYGTAINETETVMAMCDLAGDRVVFVDLADYEVLSSVDISNLGGLSYSQPNDAVYANGKLYVTPQVNESLLVFDQLPSSNGGVNWEGALHVDNPTPESGDSITIQLASTGGMNGLVALVSSSGNTPTVAANGMMLGIGPDHFLRATGQGMLSVHYQVPATALLRGLHFYVQGIVDARGNAGFTEPRAIVLQ